jgi:hypothetical protein
LGALCDIEIIIYTRSDRLWAEIWTQVTLGTPLISTIFSR